MRLRVALHGHQHNAEVANGSLARVGAIVAALGACGRVAVVSDATVFAAQGDALHASLRGAGLEPVTLNVPEGEAGKTLAAVQSLVTQLADHRFERGGWVIAFGGGAMTDLAGFVAATFKRGMRLVNVPTSLLAQIDSCLGGKNGVNLTDAAGHLLAKNMIGTFHHPAVIVVDPLLLATLDDRYYRSGLGELAKYAMLASDTLLGTVMLHAKPDARFEPDILQDMIRSCLTLKRGIVEKDPRDHGDRRLLNFGHTFGHALEAYRGSLTHGECVALGMVVATRVAANRQLCTPQTCAQLTALLHALGLPTRLEPGDADGAMKYIAMDKKWHDGRLSFVLPKRPGKLVIVDDVTEEKITHAAHEVTAP